MKYDEVLKRIKSGVPVIVKEQWAQKYGNDSVITHPYVFDWIEKEENCFEPVDFKVLSILVYRSDLGDCTGGGVSATAKWIYVPCHDGPDKASQVNQGLIFFPEQRGEDYWALKQKRAPEETSGLNGPMFGGNLATSSDSRDRHIYYIHDRYEVPMRYGD